MAGLFRHEEDAAPPRKAWRFAPLAIIGILPGAFSCAWLGQAPDSILVAARRAGRDIAVFDLVPPEITIAFVALALVAALSLIVRRMWGSRAR